MSFLPGSEIEIITPNIERGRVCSVLFDFDGTLSLIRQGWQNVMVPMMVEILQQLDTGESKAELTHLVTDFVDRLTGKQTIYQMIELCAQIEARRSVPDEPLSYKRQYLDLLWEQIEHRVVGLKQGTIPRQDMIVPGAFDILDNLQRRGLTCYLASGTDQLYVLDEAAALGIAPYFQGPDAPRIFGALDEYERFSKAQVIQDILRDHKLIGTQLLAFGDGYVEIEETKRAGGIAVGVATDEVRRTGVDEWKRERLIRAGADVIIPHFGEQEQLVAYLWNE